MTRGATERHPMTSQVIPDAAVEAAAVAWTRLMCGCYDPEDVPHLHDELRKILQAAIPHITSDEVDSNRTGRVLASGRIEPQPMQAGSIPQPPRKSVT